MQDPDSGKTGASVIGEQDPSSKPYYEGNVDDSTVQEVVIQQPQNSLEEADPSALYAGQKHITARKIYNALETYVKDSNGKTYYWSNLKDANGNDVHFGVFVRINGIRIGDTFFSFLNEATGEYDKTLDEIPRDATEIKISASYRLSEGSAWKDYADITCTLKRNRIFILNRRLTESDKNTQFDNGILLNPYTDTSFDPDDESAIIDLYSYQRDLLGEKRLSALFPGWLEDGKLIPWMYHPAAGRHVIEPADMVPLWDNYTVQVKICWYDTDTGAVTRFQDDAADGLAAASLDETEPDLPVGAPQFSITQKFIYMQTLTGYEGDPGSVLEVPKYVQAVDMGTENTLHEVDYIKIPDTVRYVNTKNYSEQPEGTQTAVKGITVKKGYIVDADSTAYAATADGILTNADGSAYLGIPYDMTELTVPENVEKVTLRERNYVVPEDVQSMFVDVCAHRLALRPQARVEGVAVKQVLAEIMTKIKPAHTEERDAMWKNRLAFALLTAEQLGLHMTSGSRAITRRAVAWCLGISAVLCACAVRLSGTEMPSVDCLRQNIKQTVHDLRYGRDTLLLCAMELTRAFLLWNAERKRRRMSIEERVRQSQKLMFKLISLWGIDAVLGWATSATDKALADTLPSVKPGGYERVNGLLEKTIYGGIALEPFEERALDLFVQRLWGRNVKKSWKMRLKLRYACLLAAK